MGEDNEAESRWVSVAEASRDPRSSNVATVLFVKLVVYVPIGVVERASLQNDLNYVADTLMFGGAILLLAGAMPREA